MGCSVLTIASSRQLPLSDRVLLLKPGLSVIPDIVRMPTTKTSLKGLYLTGRDF